jgi:hypothetical protein
MILTTAWQKHDISVRPYLFLKRRNKMKKSTIAIIAVSLVLVICLGVVGGVSSGFQNWDTDTWFNKNADKPIESAVAELIPSIDDYSFEMISTQNIFLSAGEAMAASDTPYPQQELTAVITPDSARDKYVSWSVAWATPNSDFASGKTVTEYVTVTPESDGSLKSTVTCLKAFGSDKINVVVTTRDGGFTATCIVSFVGIPTIIATSTAMTPNGEVYMALPSKGNALSIDLNNVFNSVGDTYKNFTYTLTSIGTFYVDVMDDWGGVSSHGSHALSDLQTTYLPESAIRLSGSTLTITPENIYAFASGERQYFISDGEYEDFGWATFGGYNADSYFQLTITQPTTNLSCTFKFQIDRPAVSKVSVYKTELSF